MPRIWYKSKEKIKLDSINDVEKTKNNKKELSVFEKVCFALAGLPYQMYFCAVSVYVTVFLLEQAKLPPKYTTYILFISRIIDAITDPIYGYFVNKTKVTKFGRMKPWIIFSFPITALSYIMMWYVPNFNEVGLFIWYTFWHSFMFTVITGVRIPHTAMTMYLCNSQEERQSATVYRMAFEMIGLLLALGIQGPFVSGNSCKNSTEIFTSNTTTIAAETFENISFWEKEKYVIFAAILTVIYIFGNVMLVVFVKEKNIVETNNENESKLSTIKELWRIFTYKPYLILFCASVLNTLAIQILQANLQLYFEYGYYKIKNLFVVSLLLLLTLAIVFVPLWQFLMKKIGKIITFIIGNLALLPLLIAALFFRDNNLAQIIPFCIMSGIGAVGFTNTFLLPWAMLPESVDAYFVKYNSRPDALFFTFFTLGTKILMAVYLGVSQVVLDLVGYKNGVCAENQNSSVQTAVIYLFSPIPMAFLVISSIIIYFYPITDTIAQQNTEIIKQLKEKTTINAISYDNHANNEFVPSFRKLEEMEKY